MTQNNELFTNRIALGTAQFGLDYGIANRQGKLKFSEVSAIIECAKAHGMDLLDTAFSYGDSEQRLGKIGVHGWKVVTKLPAIPDELRDVTSFVVELFQESLERLKLKGLYGILLHQPKSLMSERGSQIYKALKSLKDEGLVHKIGISIYDQAELNAICHNFDIDLVQAPFNLIDHRLIDSGWLTRFSAKGIELHVRSIFLQGLLLMPLHERCEKFNRWKSLWFGLEDWLNLNRITPLQACLRFVLSFPEVKKIIVGIDSLRQLNEIIEASQGEMPQFPRGIGTNDIDLLNPSLWQVQ